MSFELYSIFTEFISLTLSFFLSAVNNLVLGLVKKLQWPLNKIWPFEMISYNVFDSFWLEPSLFFTIREMTARWADRSFSADLNSFDTIGGSVLFRKSGGDNWVSCAVLVMGSRFHWWNPEHFASSVRITNIDSWKTDGAIRIMKFRMLVDHCRFG